MIHTNSTVLAKCIIFSTEKVRFFYRHRLKYASKHTNTSLDEIFIICFCLNALLPKVTKIDSSRHCCLSIFPYRKCESLLYLRCSPKHQYIALPGEIHLQKRCFDKSKQICLARMGREGGLLTLEIITH